MSKCTIYIKATLLTFGLIFNYPLSAQAGINYSDEKYLVQLGFFRPAINTTIRVNSESLGIGDQIDFEDDLGYKKYQDAYRLDGYWRIKPRHRLQFSYFDYDRSAVAITNSEIQIGDTIFPAGSSIKSNNSVSVAEIGYMYSLKQTTDYEISVIGGIHWLSFDTELKNSSGTLNEIANTEGPLPLFGLDIQYKVRPDINFNLRGQYYNVDIGDVDGSFTNIRTSLEYYFKENVGIGIGYNDFTLDVDVDGSNFLGNLEWNYQGFQLFVTMRFK